MARKHNAVIVLDALLNGQDVALNGHTYRWDKDRGQLVMIARDGNDAEVLLGTWGHDTTTWFVNECEKLPFEEVFVLGSQNVLTGMAKERADKRAALAKRCTNCGGDGYHSYLCPEREAPVSA